MSVSYHSDDTIVAVATPPGIGGLAVVRVSGLKSIDIVENCLSSQQSLEPYRATYTHFVQPKNDETIDEVVVTFFRKPKSYTAEDVVEIACHGGHYVADSIVQILIEQGARLSEPGEFTKRAFINGRIDLSQAEAVGDLIHAQTGSSHKLAIRQLQGRIKEIASDIRQQLIDTVSLLELELDFSEEEINRTSYEKIESTLKEVQKSCEQLVDSYHNGKLYRQGILVPIVGKPNAGKSSILNALLKEDRALVSTIPGTTRDTVEESISHNGVQIRLVDTAGLRESDDTVESMGIDRTKQIMQQADLILRVIDTQTEIDDPGTPNEFGIPEILVCNKIDLSSGENYPEYQGNSYKDVLYTSATEMTGISKIGDAILRECTGDVTLQESPDTPTITNKRHRNALREATASLDRAIQSTRNRESAEFIVVDLRAAMDSMGLVTGETTTDDILNTIFSKFCIGK